MAFSFARSAGMLALGLMAIGCGDAPNGGFVAGESSGEMATTSSSSGSENALPILSQMQGVLDTTPFRGVRRAIVWQDGLPLEQLEDVGADGSGDFAIELLEVVSLPPDVDDLSYPVVFEASARFQWTMRDFQVRDAAIAAQAFLVQVLPETPVVAGIGCVRLSFLRTEELGGRPGHYHVDVDPNTGFVLGWVEFGDGGDELASVRYESFEYDGDVQDMVLRGRAFTAAPLDSIQPLQPQVSFPVHSPELLPGGMRVGSVEVQTVPASLLASVTPGRKSYLPTGEWLRIVATNGVEVIAFAHSAAAETGANAELGELQMTELGAWTVGIGRLQGTKFVVAARATMLEIEQIVASAF